MKRNFPLLLLSSLLMVLFHSPSSFAQETSTGLAKIVLVQNSTQMWYNDNSFTAAQPLTTVKGVTYVAASSFMNAILGTIAYDAKTRQYTLISRKDVLKMQAGKSAYSVNGASKTMTGAPYTIKGTLMIPIRTVASVFGMTLKSFPSEKKIVLTWSNAPIAKFSVSDTNPYATQTEVKYKNEAYHPGGLAIVEERWENNDAIFDEAGTYSVTHWVKDERGTWSDPYTVSITVHPPNQPPIASFATDKDIYRMGELISYIDQSTDDENQIISAAWKNNARGFFVPGQQTVTLTVTDSHGEVGEFSKTIMILDETLYTKEEFDLKYMEIGEKFDINGPSVLQLPMMAYTINDREQTLIRANSPETMLEEGIYYEDNVNGNVRFMLHNRNGRSTPMKIYILLTNNNADPVNVRLGAVGMAGPNRIVSTVGKAVTGRFLESLLNPKYSYLQIPAGESRLIFQEYSSKILEEGDVYSMFADAQLSNYLDFKVIAINADRDLTSALPTLRVLPSHEKHIRGTFENANRVMYVNQTIGDVKSRMVLADNFVDTRLSGIDKTTGTPVLNVGNYGVVYTIQLGKVQPHTAIGINPRGGHYAGAFNVNNKTVYATNTSILNNPNEVCMLYKTGDSVETVTITFTPANGSMLPINLLFLPMPTH
ncbi:copper amine oxidase N-terminal domain-containing protein [Cohnella terricola]|uniref:Copper amine oxidase N-terminal domain-containing protein n=2 Tax=Cohnella terricola TaxID=1289167 RepID=A0A559JQJ0_9BACL|nr:copper amine oxidase N-terminal domain-containing protein [Cohnella terricola]